MSLQPIPTPAEPTSAEDDYFSSNPPPPALAAISVLTRSFIATHALHPTRRVVLVTSGGTTVPLERNTVRFIDNFSAGTRGATSAEYFLARGYAVVFLHRQFSLLPFARHYSHSAGSFLDFLEEDGAGGLRVAHNARPEDAGEGVRDGMVDALRRYAAAKRDGLLLMVPFVTITDYLYVLREVASQMKPLGPRGLLYLAAAVSDFFVPPERMAEHKIQSTNVADTLGGRSSKAAAVVAATTTTSSEVKSPSESVDPVGMVPTAADDEETFDNFDSSPRVPRSKRLVINLDPVPKFLKSLVDGWAPQGMIVSFKLETDPEILVHKARASLQRYQHHLVVGNLLATRKWEVVFVSPGREDQWLRVPRQRRRRGTTSGVEALVGASERAARKAAAERIREDGGEMRLERSRAGRPLDPKTLPDGEPGMEIEALIIPAIQALHDEHIRKCEEKEKTKNNTG